MPKKNLLQQPRKYCLNPLHPARRTVHTKLVNIKFSITSLETSRVILTKFPAVTDQKLVSEGKAWVTFAESLFRCSHWGSTRQYGTSSPADCRTFRLSFDILIWQLSNHNYILSPWMVFLWNDPSWKFATSPRKEMVNRQMYRDMQQLH